MAWDDLRFLEAVERHRSVAHAARELGVAPSTVYRRVAELEREVGAPCLVRGETPATLTDTGRALAALARQVQGSLRAIGQEHAQARERIEGHVSLTTVEGFLPFLIEPWRTLARRHPELTLELHLSDQGPSVWRREVDLAIAVLADPPEGLIGRRLQPVRYGVFGTAPQVADSRSKWVLGAPEQSPHGVFERALAGARVAMTTTTRHAAVAFVREGLGVGLLPRRIAALHDLVEREGIDGLDALDRPVWLLTHPELRDVARVRAVMDVLSDALSD